MTQQMALFDVDDRPMGIRVKRETLARIRRATGCEYGTIRAALRFETKTALARQIRAWAMMEGGRVTYRGLDRGRHGEEAHRTINQNINLKKNTVL